jgi:hypothetical protein
MIDQETKEFEAQVQRQLEERAALVGGKAWGVAQGKPRIYLRSRRDVKVYVDYPDYPTGDSNDLLGGPALRVLINECDQHSNWYASQREKLMRDHRGIFLALSIWSDGDPQLAAEIAEEGIDVDDATLDAVANHSANGRFIEARQLLSL